MSFDMLSHKAEGNVVKNKWLSFFSGKVQLELTGRGIERLLNECTRQGFRSFMSKKKEAVSLYIQLQDVHAFRRVRRKFKCKARFINRKDSLSCY